MDGQVRSGSRLLATLRAHPVAALIVTFLLVCGVACGISTAAAMGEMQVLGERLGLMGGDAAALGYIRLAAFNLALFAVLNLAAFFSPVLLVAVPLLVIKGFALGLAAWEPALVLRGWGVIYGVFFELLPAGVTCLALLLSFVQAVQKRPKLLAVVKETPYESRKMFWRNLVLLLMGTLLESGVFPLAMKLLGV